MLLTSKDMARLCRMSLSGIHKMTKRLKIPHIKKGKRLIFDTNQGGKLQGFFDSIELITSNPDLQVFYSLRDLSKLRGQHKDTIKSFLIEHDIKMYRNGVKILVLLIDLKRLQSETINEKTYQERTK